MLMQFCFVTICSKRSMYINTEDQAKYGAQNKRDHNWSTDQCLHLNKGHFCIPFSLSVHAGTSFCIVLWFWKQRKKIDFMLNHFITNLPALLEHCKASVEVLGTSSTDWISYVEKHYKQRRWGICIFSHEPMQIQPSVCIYLCIAFTVQHNWRNVDFPHLSAFSSGL
jgi:hypothetical protein